MLEAAKQQFSGAYSDILTIWYYAASAKTDVTRVDAPILRAISPNNTRGGEEGRHNACITIFICFEGKFLHSLRDFACSA